MEPNQTTGDLDHRGWQIVREGDSDAPSQILKYGDIIKLGRITFKIKQVPETITKDF